jgi:hypothetical protein
MLGPASATTSSSCGSKLAHSGDLASAAEGSMFWLAPDRFDDLTRTLGATTSRRQALRLLVGGLAASLLAVVRDGVTSPAAAANCLSEDYKDCLRKATARYVQVTDECVAHAPNPSLLVQCKFNVLKTYYVQWADCSRKFGGCGSCQVCDHVRAKCRNCGRCDVCDPRTNACLPSNFPKPCIGTSGPVCCRENFECCQINAGCCPPGYECCPGHSCCDRSKGFTCQNPCGCCPPDHTCKPFGNIMRCSL